MSNASDNYFTRLADAQMVAATKAKHKRREVKLAKSEADAPMKLSPQEQAVADREALLRRYRAASKAEFKALIEGENGPNWWALEHKLKTLTPDSIHLLLDFIKDPNCWLHAANLHTRQTALSIIAARLLLLRLERGMAPFDDSLPGEELTAFEIIRDYLKVLTS